MSEKPGWEPDTVEELTQAPAPQDAPRMGALARVVQVFTSPLEVFRDIARKPTWAAILLLTTLVAVGTQMAALPHLDMERTVREQMERRGAQMTEEQMDRLSADAGKYAWIGLVSTAVFVPLFTAIMAGLYLLGLKLAGSEIDFVRTFSTVLHAYWPASVTKAAMTVALLLRAGTMTGEELQYLVKSNLAAFLPAEAPRWQVALGSMVDVFNVWTVWLLVVGLATVGGLSPKRAGVVVGTLWVFYIAAKVALVAVAG